MACKLWDGVELYGYMVTHEASSHIYFIAFTSDVTKPMPAAWKKKLWGFLSKDSVQDYPEWVKFSYEDVRQYLGL